MSTTTVPTGPDTLHQRSRIGWAVQDALAVAHRNLIALVRVPTTLAFSTFQPVIFGSCSGTSSGGPSRSRDSATSTT